MFYAATGIAMSRGTAMDGYIARGLHRMMKRIARTVRHRCPTDAIAMLKETLLASGMVMKRIDSHVILIIVSKLVVVR